MTNWAGPVVAYAVASRLVYVGWVGFALRREERTQYFTRTFGVERGFRRFRLWTMIVMRNDAASLILTCILTRNTLNIGIPPVVEWLAGGALIVIGFGTKEWAARTLGNDAYYWHNFFEPGSHAAPNPPGPYRYIKNPMYTIGYLHAYGLAIVFDSAWGLVVTLFAQLGILAFHRLVEQPHYERLTVAAASPGSPSPSATR